MAKVPRPGTRADAKRRGIHVTPLQQMFHDAVAQYRFVGFGGARGPGKLLSLDTPVPTPSGWKTIGDLAVGDFVFSAGGKPTRVEYLSPIDPSPESYRLTFDDGESIDCCVDHLWLTFDSSERAKAYRRTDEFRAKRRASRGSRVKWTPSDCLISHNRAIGVSNRLPAPEGTVRTTREIVETLRSQGGRQINHAVPMNEAWKNEAIALPIPPYVLGCWLGDGCKWGGVITTEDPEIFDSFGDYVPRLQSSSAHKTAKNYRIAGLTTKLRELGLIKNKHVPEAYLRGSEDQRLALLQGLMDTDGHCSPRDGACEFCNTNIRLAEAVYLLVWSLGIKAALREGRATLNGVDCGPKYRVCFTPTAPVFRLKRKLAHLQKKNRATQKWRYIVSAEKIDSVPMRCLRVEDPSHLFAVGRTGVLTHNTFALNHECLIEMIHYPGIELAIVRKDLVDLKDTTMQVMNRYVLPPYLEQGLSVKWKGGNRPDMEVTIDGKTSRLMWRDAKDVGSLMSANLASLAIDEAAETSEDFFLTMVASLGRCTLPDGRQPPARLFWASNPGPGWCKDYFPVGKRPLRRIRQIADHVLELVFIPALAKDNPNLPANFEETLRAIYPDHYVKRLVEGDWSAFEGQIFTSFDPTVGGPHVWKYEKVNDLRLLDYPYTHIIALDWGYRSPSACLRVSIDYEGRFVVWGEYRAAERTPAQHAPHIKQLMEPLPYSTIHVIDPAAKDQSSGLSIAQQFRALDDGFHFRGWPKRKHGSEGSIAFVQRLLQERKLVIREDCAGLIAEMCNARWRPMSAADAQHNPKEEMLDKDDHSIDALFGACEQWRQQPAHPIYRDTLDHYAAMARTAPDNRISAKAWDDDWAQFGKSMGNAARDIFTRYLK